MSQKKFKIFLISLLVFGTNISLAQKWEIGGLLGASNYNGELAREIVLKETHLAGGIYMRYNLGKYFSVKPALNVGTISGNDKNFKENKNRNLSFRSNITELSVNMEFNFRPFGSQVRTENFTPYLQLGIAGFRFNPKTKYNGDIFELHNLHTEGQTNKEMYKLYQIAIPFGIGFKWEMSENMIFGYEFVYRKTFTDYLDDVSKRYPDLTEQKKKFGTVSAALSDRSVEVEGVTSPLSTTDDMRGDPALKDWYMFSMFSFTYRFTPIICWPKKPPVLWDY
ncbi:MAG: outer membrane beta-barrel protein [Bacteroidetes bacterium]|nr:outer membrane beta-barrel protein [Bacteroidota bacterium]